jgi:dTDP-glucose 4,6-dehydratase/GDP-L-fucose synthase
MTAVTERDAAYWDDKSVLITGGGGFLGGHVLEALRHRSESVEIFAPRSADYDLRVQADIRRAFTAADPDVVIHLAATVGGIGANLEHPGQYFYENAIMGIETIEMARLWEVERCAILGTICSYPKHTETPFSEDSLYDGYPEETNAPYGIAKKALLTQLQAYRDEYGLDGIYLMPVNLYGPGDNFDLASSHVIPAIIRKCLEARDDGDDEIVAWGTGTPTREFLYVRDAADGILTATERYTSPLPVNLGSGEEISIRDLVTLIADLTGFDGEVVWDTSKPDGQPRRRLDTSRARDEFGWEAQTGLREGLRQTIDWYERERHD